MLMSCGKKDTSLKKFIAVPKKTSPFCEGATAFSPQSRSRFSAFRGFRRTNLRRFFFYQKGVKSSLPFYRQALSQLIFFQEKVKTSPADLRFDKNFF